MITTLMTTVISASPQRIWRALTDAHELIRLDHHLIELLDPFDDYPQPGQHVRWRYRLGSIPIVFHDSPIEVDPPTHLRSAIALGLFHLDASYSLVSDTAERDRTRVTLKLVASNSVPVVGGLLDRFGVRRLASEHADSRLRSLQKWCENHP